MFRKPVFVAPSTREGLEKQRDFVSAPCFKYKRPSKNTIGVRASHHRGTLVAFTACAAWNVFSARENSCESVKSSHGNFHEQILRYNTQYIWL